MRRIPAICICLAIILLAPLQFPIQSTDWALEPLYSFEPLPAVSNDVRAGDTVFFGQYEQDNLSGNGKEDIAWTVLEIRDDKVLLLSKYILDAIPYHRKSESVTWENCTLRQWLNSIFMQTAFTSAEAANIFTVTVDNPWNTEYGIRGGNQTSDQVFLLSYDDATTYFWADADRRAYATSYALERGVYVSEENGRSWWWLRSPGKTEDRAGNVHSTGAASTYGGFVYSGQGGVRPALWVKKSALKTTYPAVKAAPVFLIDLPIYSKSGKLWIRTSVKPSGYYHTKKDAPGCWSDTTTPGYTIGTVKDQYGNTYTYGMHLDDNTSNAKSISYKIDGKYKCLTGMIAYPSSVINATYAQYGQKIIEVRGDGGFLFRSNTMGKNTYQSVNIDVTGVSILEIRYLASDNPNEAATLFDFMLS